MLSQGEYRLNGDWVPGVEKDILEASERGGPPRAHAAVVEEISPTYIPRGSLFGLQRSHCGLLRAEFSVVKDKHVHENAALQI